MDRGVQHPLTNTQAGKPDKKFSTFRLTIREEETIEAVSIQILRPTHPRIYALRWKYDRCVKRA